MKNIENIVIYKSTVNGTETVKSCVFYSDGTVEHGTYEDGIAAVKIVAKEKNITSKDALKEMINKSIFHAMTEEEFNKNYSKFVKEVSKEEIDEAFKKSLDKLKKDSTEENVIPKTFVYEPSKFVVEEKEETPFINENDVEEVVLEENYDGDSSYTDFTADHDSEIEDEELEEEIEYDEDNFINNSGAKLRENHLGAKILAVGLGLAIGATMFACCHRKSKTGEMTDSNLPTPTPVTTTINDEEYGPEYQEVAIEYNNDLYNDYSFTELLEVTQNEFQKNSMINLSASLNGFNGTFANAFVESGNDIRAALSFDEVVALQQAYNNYSIDEVRAYFNGYEVNAIDMSNAYKNASLQLMGAYVLETSENPVDMSILIDSQEGRDFYSRYNNLFIAAKEATGEEKLQLVNEFYEMVRADFPITEEVRTEGISHSEDRNSIEDYQLSVAPMIAAAEMLFQNLDVDYTLDTIENNISEIDFINDIGLCNHADDKFERLETIMLGSYEDNTNPLFEQYRNAIIAELTNNNNYVIDDAHRELANLRSFQLIVNGENNNLGNYSNAYSATTSGSYTSASSSTTSTETTSWEESSTTTWEETTTETAPIPASEQAAIDAAIAQENERARQAAEDAAAAEAQRQQAVEDANAQNVNNQVQQENNQLQNDINNINNTINNGGTVNENNYSNIDFDDNYTDSNGNLDGSVQNVTADGTGANQPLPDPNVTGESFDAIGNQMSYNSAYEVEQEESSSYAEWVDVDEGSAFIEYSDDYIPFDEDGNPIVIEENGYQYTR